MACSYGFDGNGKRVKKTEGGASTYYVYSSVMGSAVMEVASGGVQRAYVMGSGNVIAQRNADGQFYWLHADHLGSGRKMTDTSGNLTYRAEFDPYGKLLYEWSLGNQANRNSKKFTGYERDAGSGLDFAQARMYGSEWGRFLSPDPKGFASTNKNSPLTLNRYSYAGGNPANNIDRAGTDFNLFSLPGTGSIFGSWFYNNQWWWTAGTPFFNFADSMSFAYINTDIEVDYEQIITGAAFYAIKQEEEKKNKSTYDLLFELVYDASKRMFSNKGCRDFLSNIGNGANGNPLFKLHELYIEGRVKTGSMPNPLTQAASYSPLTDTITLAKGLYNALDSSIKAQIQLGMPMTPGTIVVFNELVADILHEAGHATRAYIHDDFFNGSWVDKVLTPNVAKYQKEYSNAYINKSISEKCF